MTESDLKKYSKLVSSFISERLGVKMPKDNDKLNELIEENYDVFQIEEKQKNKLIKLKYNNKIRHLSNAIKTVHFMERYKLI